MPANKPPSGPSSQNNLLSVENSTDNRFEAPIEDVISKPKVAAGNTQPTQSYSTATNAVGLY